MLRTAFALRPIYHYLTPALIAYLLMITPGLLTWPINFNEIETYGPVLGTWLR
ncbi:MAG: hypothetical protein H6631_08995 [Anaerolineaceae bacterium]|nr:hypothetical protein [Anaerolineaceae bacterium]